MKTSFFIASILPFWRYAVCPQSNDLPGIPFYRLKSAEKFFRETKEEIPWFPCYLVKRHWNNKVEVIHSWKSQLDSEL
jgi:hypothetical protein